MRIANTWLTPCVCNRIYCNFKWNYVIGKSGIIWRPVSSFFSGQRNISLKKERLFPPDTLLFWTGYPRNCIPPRSHFISSALSLLTLKAAYCTFLPTSVFHVVEIILRKYEELNNLMLIFVTLITVCTGVSCGFLFKYHHMKADRTALCKKTWLLAAWHVSMACLLCLLWSFTKVMYWPTFCFKSCQFC